MYIGVGPEQNFSYIAALRPKLAFIVDVRRGNTDLHLMYKALFELSRGSRRFCVAAAVAAETWRADAEIDGGGDLSVRSSSVDPNERMLNGTLADIRHQLTTVHKFPLTGDDLTRIEAIFRVFYLAGTKIQYSPYGSFGGTTQPTYADLMAATDETGEARSFLASEATVRALRDFERRNLLVPLVGDFAGPKTIKAIGDYARRQKRRDVRVLRVECRRIPAAGAASRLLRNVASLPLTVDSTFIRAVRGDTLNPSIEGFVNQLAPMLDDARRCGVQH